MRIEITYFADDGTEFDSEKECLAYEEANRQNFNSVIFFNGDLERMYNPSLVDVEEMAFGMYIVDEEKAIDLWDWLYNVISFATPSVEIENGTFLWYDDKEDDWVDVGKETTKWMDRLKKMRSQLEATP